MPQQATLNKHQPRRKDIKKIKKKMKRAPTAATYPTNASNHSISSSGILQKKKIYYLMRAYYE
jgi:hypothetical protein